MVETLRDVAKKLGIKEVRILRHVQGVKGDIVVEYRRGNKMATFRVAKNSSDQDIEDRIRENIQWNAEQKKVIL